MSNENEENIVKRTCQELGISQKESTDINDRLMVSKELIKKASAHKEDEKFASAISDKLGSIVSLNDVRDILEEEIVPINIIKKTCKELGLTYRELGEAIGYSEGALKTAVSTDKISSSMEKAIELYKRTLELEKEIENSNKIKLTLKEWLK